MIKVFEDFDYMRVGQMQSLLEANGIEGGLEQLTAALPRLQFVVTSHSPLLAGSLRPENLVLLEPDGEAESEGHVQGGQVGG